MTLVDLPGLTKNPVGAQTATVMEDIKNMVENFIKNPNCIILAVSPAIDDIANSEVPSLRSQYHSPTFANPVNPSHTRNVTHRPSPSPGSTIRKDSARWVC